MDFWVFEKFLSFVISERNFVEQSYLPCISLLLW